MSLRLYQYWRQVYLVTVLAMILAVFLAHIHPNFLSKQWRRPRWLAFCALASGGLVPVVHWVCDAGGFSSELVQVSSHGFFINRAPPPFFIYFFVHYYCCCWCSLRRSPRAWWSCI